jgi:hypothetical protein
MKKIIRFHALLCTLVIGQVLNSLALGQTESVKVAPELAMRSLGIFVTLARLSQVTESGVQAIPMGALVSVVEDSNGQKFAVFKQLSLPIHNLNQLSSDPAKIAASATAGNGANSIKGGNVTPGAMISQGEGLAPKASTQEQIRVDDSGKVISRSKTTTINDGAGNTTTIIQGRSSGMSPEQAAKLAAAQQKINLQRETISELKSRRGQGRIISGYEAKLNEMNNLLSRMEIEMARMRVEFSH